MGNRVRATKEELQQIETLTKEGLTLREIGQRLNRSEASVRNLRYKKKLGSRAKSETGVLVKQRDEMNSQVKALQIQRVSLTNEVNKLAKTKDFLEVVIKTDKFLLEQTFAKTLVGLKQQRPDLFYYTGEEQNARILKALFEGLSKTVDVFK